MFYYIIPFEKELTLTLIFAVQSTLGGNFSSNFGNCYPLIIFCGILFLFFTYF